MTLSRKKLMAFGFGALGANLLNLTVAVYLLDALLTAGFESNIENWTFLNRDLVVAGAFAIIITISKVIDGLIDIPIARFLDGLNTKFGKRRAGMLIGFVPMVVSFLLFLLPLSEGNQVLNTVWFGILLVIFYISYTCVMLAYYASFAEITQDDGDRRHLANVKSVADVFYFVIVFAGMPALIGFMNIRLVALFFSPLALLILIPLFLLKKEGQIEAKAKEEAAKDPTKAEKVPGMVKSFLYVCKNKAYMRWMVVFALSVFGSQMFLTGQNVFLSGAGYEGMSVMIINICAFGPVPFTMILYNYIIKRKGFRFGFLYAMLTHAAAMGICALAYLEFFQNSGLHLVIAIVGGLAASLGIGSFFSIVYLIPSHLAAKEREETGRSHPSMYFAVQGLISAIVTAISTGIVWVNMKTAGYTYLMTIVVAVALILCCISTIILPKSFSELGKESKR